MPLTAPGTRRYRPRHSGAGHAGCAVTTGVTDADAPLPPVTGALELGSSPGGSPTLGLLVLAAAAVAARRFQRERWPPRHQPRDGSLGHHARATRLGAAYETSRIDSG